MYERKIVLLIISHFELIFELALLFEMFTVKRIIKTAKKQDGSVNKLCF